MLHPRRPGLVILGVPTAAGNDRTTAVGGTAIRAAIVGEAGIAVQIVAVGEVGTAVPTVAVGEVGTAVQIAVVGIAIGEEQL